MLTVPRESAEFVAVTITTDGKPVTDGVEFAVLPRGLRPVAESWTPAVRLGAAIGIQTGGREPGRYALWYRVTTSLEAPVDVVDLIDVT